MDAQKRGLDILLAVFGLLVLSPFLSMIALIVWLEDFGPVFYRGLRVGYSGKPFRIFKFRSMVVNAEKMGGSSTADDDPRITRIGRLLRKYKIDELPQLLNVLKGDMSFVGPRPEVPQYVELYTPEEKCILTVRPGITDWASLWNSDEGALLSGSLDPDKTYLEVIRPQKLMLQMKYVRERTFFTDLKIIIQTLLKVVQR
jgi:lipopolysaccharide/colanic/teichoic acid biosynthesis glycosyltransferase